MKKLTALFLSLLMVFSTAAIAHAAVSHPVKDVGGWYTASDGVVNLSSSKSSANYAATVYAPLLDEDGDLITSYEAAKNVRATISTYILGKENTGGVSIVAASYEKWSRMITDPDDPDKKINDSKNDAEGVAYFVALKLAGTRRAETDYATGVITVKKTGTDAFGPVELPYNLSLSVGSPKVATEITSSAKRFAFGEGDANCEFEMTQAAGTWYFTVDTIGQDDLLLSGSVNANNTVWERYPDAYLEFFTGNNASFDKVGEMRITSERGNYIYAIDRSNNLSVIESALRDGDTFTFPTRTLGTYVVSDVELDLSLQDVAGEETGADENTEADSGTPEPGDEIVKAVPETGAKA